MATNTDTVVENGTNESVDRDSVNTGGENSDTIVEAALETISDSTGAGPDIPAATDNGTTTTGSTDFNTDTGNSSDSKADTETGMDVGMGSDTGSDTGSGADAEFHTDTHDIPTAGDSDGPVPCTPENAETVCGSPYCVDGYCCNERCSGECEACDVSGFEGFCYYIPSGQDLDDECEAQDANTCGTTGSCNGQGECERYGNETTCSLENECRTGRCNGEGNCEEDGFKPDFTPCTVVTQPEDRSYDICVDGVCVSPGCGSAECNVPRPHFTLADTNQRLCYSNENEIPCPTAETAAYYGQDALYGWDVDHSSDERYTRDIDTPGEPVVLDNVTGLIWQGCALGVEGQACDTENSPVGFQWEDALYECETLEWGGHTDWRLPDVKELRSIVDNRLSSPSIDETSFPAATPNKSYWSSSSRADYLSYAWKVSFSDGIVNYEAKDELYYVRCVRSGP